MEVIYRPSDGYGKWPSGKYYVQYRGALIEVSRAGLLRSLQGFDWVTLIYHCDDPLDPGYHILYDFGIDDELD